MSGPEMSESEKEETVKSPQTQGKIQRSLSSMVDQMKLSDEEMKYRMDHFENVNVVKDYSKYLKCTKCNMNFQSVINMGDTVSTHPILGVLMCDSCCDYYGDGNFSLDSEGEDKYCRWCGEGGTIFACSKCICGFCDACIKKHFGEKGLENVKNDDDWICYFCNPEPLWYLRSICSLAKEAAGNKRDQLKNNKQGRSVKQRRRKRESSDFNSTSDSSSGSNSSRRSVNFKNKTKRRKLSKIGKTKRKGASSSSEDEKENHMNSRTRGGRSKKQTPPRDATSESSESDTKGSKKRKNSDEENDLEFVKKRTDFLQKLKSIWKLTQTITEVGLSSSRGKLRSLSKTDRFRTMERLKKEHDDLKSCMNVLVSSLNTASNSVNSIQEDLSFDTTKDETESFRSQEIKLKTYEEKFHEESDDMASVDSEGNSFRKEFESKDGRKKERMREKGQSFKKKKRGDNKNSEEEEKINGGRKNKSRSLSRGSGSDKQEENNTETGGENKGEGKDCVPGEESGPAKPLLKVKSFARMLDENIYDKNKNKEEKTPIVIDLYDIDTDESEIDMKKKGTLDGKTPNKSLSSGEKGKSDDESKKEDSRVNDEEDKIISSAGKEDELEKSTEDDTKTAEKSSTDSTVDETKNKKKSGVRDETEKESSDEDDSRNSPGEKSEEGRAATKVRKKKKRPSKNSEESSGNAVSSSSDDEKESLEERKGKKKKTKKLSNDKGHKSKSVSKKSNEKENESKHMSEEEKSDGKETSGEVNDKTKESDDDGSDKEKEMTKTEPSKGENEEKEKKELKKREEGQPRGSDDEGQMEKTKSNNESEDKKESSGSEKEKVKKTSSKDKKDDSSDSDSTSEEEAGNRITRSQKKELKTSFEKFKRKREKFLKSSKESSQPESDKEKVEAKKALDSSESDNEKKESKSKKQKKRRILASSDEENEPKKTTSSEESEKENQDDKSDPEVTKPSSPSSEETSSEREVVRKKRKRIRKRSSDSSETENKGKKKKREDSSSESSDNEKTNKKKKGRKNIKKILKKDSLQVETKEALKNESDRKKRMKERQKLFEELFPQTEGDEPKQLVLDFNAETKEPLVTVHKKLVKRLKPHQMKGVKFMWDNCFESVQKLEEESGSGCILAHCMGLGKTLQVITLVHTVMTHDLGVNTVLIVCPLSTVSNWIREFETWLEKVHTEPIMLYDLVKYKKREERIFHLKDWHENGGVLVLSYDLFRTLTKVPLSKKGKQKKPKYRQVFETALIDPGPDLVVCDEGHLLKNEDTALSRCMSRVKTSRRIVLTGTPLQNNLVEYHCMVQFVKPNILGTKKEFCNRFVNPINNGQFEDSTELDVKIMKRRSHVLHSMLDGCVQRFDYSVLTPFLPEKQEYVLTISLTETQAKAYLHFINHLSAKSFGNARAASLFHDYHSLQRIWTHPKAMLMQSEREMQKDVLDRDSEGSLKDFIVSTDEETEKSGSESSDDSVQEVAPKKRILRSNANDPEVQKALEEEEKSQNKHWWDEFYSEKSFDDLRESNKLVILFSLLKYCAQKKDKILVFSQSLYSLDLIEYFLSKINENVKKKETLCGYHDTWEPGSDYFRLDGSTSSDTRAMWCKYFNKESNTRARLFLISTRAGGLGINLYGANRVVIFDASWNPSHDLQSIFRVYRFGQKKPCYIYRFLAEATMEEKIYERQVTKLSLAHRVVDEHQIERHYTMGNLQELYTFQPTPKEERKVPKLPKDPVLADLLTEYKDIIVSYHEHDSLLENKQEEELSEEERKAAWKEYEEEKIQKAFNVNPMMFPQGSFPQGGMVMPGFNPVIMNQGNMPQNFINPLYLQANFPLEALQRGIRMGVTPLPGESVESYLTRIHNREAWMPVGQAQGHEI